LGLCVLPGDFDGSGIVDFNDFAVFADNWLKCDDDGGDPADQNDVDAVTIALTRLDVNDIAVDVNDQTLELRWTIRNDSNQDIWVCNDVGWDQKPFEILLAYDDFQAYEEFLAEGDQTLVMRRRLDVQVYGMPAVWPEHTFVRLRAGEKSTESFSLSLPVRPYRLFFQRPMKRGITYLQRLVFEIGYHTKDLPRVVYLAEELYPDPNSVDKVEMSHLDPANWGEHILRITVDGVLIPYEEFIL
jgi:hypothetical protein